MCPSPKELNVIPGDGVRVKPEFLPPGHNDREVFTVREAPAHGNGGSVILVGRLTEHQLGITTDTNALVEKV